MISLSHPARLSPRQSPPFLYTAPEARAVKSEGIILGPARPGKDKPKYLVSAEGSRAQILVQRPFFRPQARNHVTQDKPRLPTMS